MTLIKKKIREHPCVSGHVTTQQKTVNYEPEIDPRLTLTASTLTWDFLSSQL
jgi:hypothetical protein